jgi:DNA-binding protein YbaB
VFDKLKQLGELKKMRDQAMAIKRSLEAEELVEEDHGIRVVIRGDQQIKEIKIEGEEPHHLVEVLNKALKHSQEVAARKLQEMGGGLAGLLKG